MESSQVEQYDSKLSDVGPWSDFYALGVKVYRCVTGVSEGELLEGSARMVLQARGEAEKDMRPAEEVARGGYDRRLLRAIDGCMKVDGRERPQDVGALRAMLDGAGPELVPKPVIATARRAVGEVFRDALKSGSQGPAMVVLPTGSFRTGSPAGEAGRWDAEGPSRTVTTGRRIAMGRYEVTFADYDRFVLATRGAAGNK